MSQSPSPSLTSKAQTESRGVGGILLKEAIFWKHSEPSQKPRGRPREPNSQFPILNSQFQTPNPKHATPNKSSIIINTVLPFPLWMICLASCPCVPPPSHLPLPSSHRCHQPALACLDLPGPASTVRPACLRSLACLPAHVVPSPVQLWRVPHFHRERSLAMRCHYCQLVRTRL